MAKSILISIKPRYVADILNHKKTIEVRKVMPKCDLPIDVYIYCTKDKPNLWLPYEYDCFELDEASQPYLSDKPIIDIDHKLNGKVVAKFTLNKVEEIIHWQEKIIYDDVPKPIIYDRYDINESSVEALSNMDFEEIDDYLQGKNGYAWYISNLVIFDRPKELSEFKTAIEHKKPKDIGLNMWVSKTIKPLTKAPQSWCYVEVEQ